MSVLTPDQLAQLMYAVWTVCFATGLLGMLIGYAVASNAINLFALWLWLWRRSRRWRRFNRAAQKVLA